MKVGKSGERYLIRLEPGDEIIETLQKWCRTQGIVNASIEGIGSVENPTLAHYRRDTKKFSEKQLRGIFEVVSLSGNVGLVDGDEPLVHLHATLSNEDMQALGGHVVEAVCSATGELVLTPLSTAFRKNYNEDIGLKVWDFDV
ncbi:MAG TPA: PPC domain-containing DNA-binding protein [Candidatus Saccharimonadales bacterium]|nr:PPC domain-containing DNA-binding protein [Candidatus Saccharimonadales bacterium]